ncbi:polyhydroxyalkanoic acid system family protein [Stakelama pacifica]|uniref:Putative polyhydroxyalkanoic acid system protein n=1 Tax=Stakelama pacifica TaxID=517720 RepID=A0A4R6FAW5_9SPHN|nr:polyhydroxyalkanoic acid system family protein [Stakelama pacifica]TDN78291.1 putative polyhydroxyalkanoic acid system protein [Stakelama pacifica]GGO99687.1 hypothetical protein GCM10011329_33740 [Stakelama pacifica]
MADPITVDIPHKLDRATARERLEKGIGKVADMIPGGAVTDHRWEGDTVFFTVEGMGQRVASRMDVGEEKVHAVIDLPPMLALFANKIREKLTREGPKLLK